MNRENKSITLSDGRRLGYAEYGHEEGESLFFFHGCPGSHVEARLADKSAQELGIKIYALDRPGIGSSTFKHKRNIGDYPADVDEFADRLGIEKFSVIGLSGGGPYANACAQKIPDRLTSVGLVSAMGPLNDQMIWRNLNWNYKGIFSMAPYEGMIEQFLCGLNYLAMLNPEYVFHLKHYTASASDSRILNRNKSLFVEDRQNAFKQGVQGVSHEVKLLSRPWDFDPADIALPVHIWHGGEDKMVPPSAYDYFRRTIPASTGTFYQKEGHFLIFERFKEIINAVHSSKPTLGRLTV